MIKLRLSNAYLAKEVRTILVDTGLPYEVHKIELVLRKAVGAPGEISLILHPNRQVDHAGSTLALYRGLSPL